MKLAVRGGVTRRADRYSWKRSIYQGYNACSKGHGETAEALDNIVAGFEGTAEVQINKRCTCCGTVGRKWVAEHAARKTKKRGEAD